MNIRERKPRQKKETNSALHLRTDFRSMMGEEGLNALSLVCIHRDIFLDYDEIINIYVSKYPRRMLLINPLSENETVEMFNVRKTSKAHMNVSILSLYSFHIQQLIWVKQQISLMINLNRVSYMHILSVKKI